MSARATMTMRATIERNMATGRDDWNGPVAEDWQPHLDGLPCRAWYGTAGGEFIDGTKTAVVEAWQMIVPVGTDIREADRVAIVADRRGRVVLAGPVRIEVVGRRVDHLPLTLQEVSA